MGILPVYCYPDYIDDEESFSMPVLLAALKDLGVSLEIRRWDGTLAGLPTVGSVIRYSSRLDIAAEIAKSDKLIGTEYETVVAQENQRQLIEHAHCISGKDLLHVAAEKGHLVIYEDHVLNTGRQKDQILDAVKAFIVN